MSDNYDVVVQNPRTGRMEFEQRRGRDEFGRPFLGQEDSKERSRLLNLLLCINDVKDKPRFASFDQWAGTVDRVWEETSGFSMDEMPDMAIEKEERDYDKILSWLDKNIKEVEYE